MNSPQPDRPLDCQYSTAFAGGVSPGFPENVRQWALRLRSAAKRRANRYLSILSRHTSARQSNTSSIVSEQDEQPFRAGDIVQVLPFEDILATLDPNRRCGGLLFMEGMRRFCSHRLVVLKRVQMIFDEQTGKMLAIRKQRYILEGAICDAQGMYTREGCDRCCFYFWSRRWLRRALQ
jgi:hypothetical protein